MLIPGWLGCNRHSELARGSWLAELLSRCYPLPLWGAERALRE